MHSAAWVKLFRHIPAHEQAKLMLVTTSGTEIAIQCFLRIDAECLALKGRLAGSQDAGRVFFIPYSQIDYFGYQNPLKESEFHEVFGSLTLPGTDADPQADPPAAAEPPKEAAAPADGSGAAPASGIRNPLAIKSTVLEKFRARSQTNPGTTMRPVLEE